MIIDGHFHQWHLARGDYGWITEDLSPLYRDFNSQHWQQARGPKVWGGVLVQCAPSYAETDFLLGIAHSHSDILAVVAWADLASPEAAEKLHGYQGMDKLAGIRPMLQDIPDPQWILQKPVLENLKKTAELGLCFDALVLPHQLPFLIEALEMIPELKVVVDHGAKPNLKEGQTRQWQRDMGILAQMDNVYCKFSGLLTEAPENAGIECLKPCSDFLLNTFGPERLIWGSDWPVLNLASDYTHWLNLSHDLMAELSDKQRQAVFAGNALNFYNIPLTQTQEIQTLQKSPKKNTAQTSKVIS